MVKRLLIKLGIFLAAAAVGLLLAALILPGMHISGWGFVWTIVVFAVLQLVFGWAGRIAPIPLVGLGIVSTIIALVVATLLVHGIRFDGFFPAIVAGAVVWAVTALATLVLHRLTRRSTTAPAKRGHA